MYDNIVLVPGDLSINGLTTPPSSLKVSDFTDQIPLSKLEKANNIVYLYEAYKVQPIKSRNNVYSEHSEQLNYQYYIDKGNIPIKLFYEQMEFLSKLLILHRREYIKLTTNDFCLIVRTLYRKWYLAEQRPRFDKLRNIYIMYRKKDNKNANKSY